MASATSTTSSRPSSNPRDSPVPAVGRQKSIPNGLRRGQKSIAESDSTSAGESNTPDQHSHDRLLFLSACAVGHRATIATTNGDVFSGIFSAPSFDKNNVKYVLKMAKKLPQSKDSQSNGVVPNAEYGGHGAVHIIIFDPQDVAVCTISDLQLARQPTRMANGTPGGFRTDTDISGNLAGRERELKPWEPSADGPGDMSLNANGHASWDQFEANERLYGVKSSYDETMYTTSIDRSNPTYRQRVAAADRKAREIEGSVNSNVHRSNLENEVDEEERYSGVRRDVQPLSTTNPNSYKPPARRAPTSNPTVQGAPVDPAIISSQLARPDTTMKPSKTPSPSRQGNALPSSTDKKENVAPELTNKPRTPVSEQGSAKAEPQASIAPNQPAAPVPSPGRTGNVADNVEKDVTGAFKQWSAGEKLRIEDRKRQTQRKEMQVKVNDLKKFAANFKLPKPVPDDLIGILAKDKKKQDEIVAKAQREAEEKKAQALKPAPTPEASKPVTPAQPELSKAPPAAPSEPSGRGRGQNRGYQSSRHEKFNNAFPGGVGRGAPPSAFSQRKMQQYPTPMPPVGPAALQTDLPLRQPMSGAPSSASSASRFNVSAIEFRPNPTASIFSPSANPSSMTTSQAGSRPVSKAQSPTKRSFFENKPKHYNDRPSIKDDFNPIKRMKKESSEDAKKGKDWAANGGIAPPYATNPTWDTRPENENKTSEDIFKQQMPQGVHPMMTPGGMMPHHQQLPPHLQQQMPHAMPPHMQEPHPNMRYSQPPPMHPGQQYHDDHRMQVSASQGPSFQSPRAQPGVMAQGSPMHGQPQPYMVQQPGMYMNQQGMPMGGYRPSSTQPQMYNGQQMMVMNGPPGGQYVQGHPQHVMYSPAAGHAYPAQPGPGTPTYSPRGAPMMMHQGSQQGHGQPMYVSHSQQGRPMYYAQQPGQPMPMRGGGYPMQQQGSYGASPHGRSQFAMHGGPQQYGGYPQQQQMHPGQMQHQNMPHGEVK